MSPDGRLVPAAVGAWLSAGLLIGVPDLAAGAAAILALAAALALLLAALGRGRARTVLAAIALAATAAGVAAGAVAADAPERRPAALTRLAAVPGTADVVLTADPRPASGPIRRTRIEGDLILFRNARGAMTVRVPVLLFADGGPAQDGLTGGIGSRIEVRTTLRPTDPGERRAYLGSARRITLMAGAPPSLAWADALRGRFAGAAAGLPGEGGDLLPGLALGDDAGLDPGLAAAMRTSSLSHLTAVSGANCAVVVAAVLLLGRPLPRIPRLALAAAVLGAFVVLVTPQPSVLRAAAMGTLVLLATARGRPGGGLPTLAVAVAALLVLDPWLALEAGFALSTLATAGLVVLAGPATALLARALPTPLAAALAVPACAQLACQPVLLLLDPTLSLWSVPANLLAAPAAPLATLAGLTSCLVLPVVPLLGTALAWVAWAPSAWIAAVARFFSEQPVGQVPWPDGPIGILLLIAVVVGLGAALLYRRARPLGLLAVALLAAGIAASGGAALGRASSMPPNWQIASCDIGQGDASLLRSGGRYALIDTGDDERALAACLDRLGARRLDLLVLTHFDRDHVGAAATLVGRADTVLVGPSDGPDADRLAATLAAGGARVHQTAAGETGRLGALSWRVLWPPARTSLPPGNPSGIVMDVTGGGLHSLFLADLGEDAQNALLRRASPSPVDVVKVSHHGSADQSPALYQRLHAAVGLVSCGAGNDYGHPTARLLGILAAVGTVPHRTDVEGMLLVAPAPNGVRVWTERAPSSAGAVTRPG